MRRGVLGKAVSGHVVHVEFELLEPGADDPRALLVGGAGRVDGGDANQIGSELDDLRGGSIYRPKHAVDGRRRRHRGVT